MIKHCCSGDCKSDSRTLEKNNDIYFIGFLNGFPKQDKNRRSVKDGCTIAEENNTP